MYTTTFVTLVTSALAGLASAQAIDPNSVDKTTRSKWCTDQKSSCPLLCLQIPGANDRPRENNCFADTLVYSCVCSNGQIPNASEYSLTIPFYQCQESQNNCVKNCGGVTSCQSACRENNPCGAQNPTTVNSSTITSSTESPTGTATDSDATATGTEAFTGFGGNPTNTDESNAGHQVQVFALGYGRVYGTATILAGVFAGFMFML